MTQHFVILIGLFIVHAYFGRKWWDQRGYPYWGFLVVCGLIGGVGGIINQILGGDTGNYAEYAFISTVILTYIAQLYPSKKD